MVTAIHGSDNFESRRGESRKSPRGRKGIERKDGKEKWTLRNKKRPRNITETYKLRLRQTNASRK